jgi:hypothetical protein
MRMEEGILRFRLRADVPRVHAAMLLDWSPKRSGQPAEWMRLTVAEDSQPVLPAAAAGYRIRVGKSQWLLYHSLTPPRVPRTAIGLHTNSETVLARLNSSGEIESLVEVEM